MPIFTARTVPDPSVGGTQNGVSPRSAACRGGARTCGITVPESRRVTPRCTRFRRLLVDGPLHAGPPEKHPRPGATGAGRRAIDLPPARGLVELRVLVAVQDHDGRPGVLMRAGVGAGGAFDAEPCERCVGVPSWRTIGSTGRVDTLVRLEAREDAWSRAHASAAKFKTVGRPDHVDPASMSGSASWAYRIRAQSASSAPTSVSRTRPVPLMPTVQSSPPAL
jgi:hypothetical protein